MASERHLQYAAADYFRTVLDSSVLWFHPMNEGKRGYRGQADFVRGGALPGLSDFVLIWGGKVGFIELKAPKGRLSPAQKDFRERCAALGHYWVVIRDLDTLRAVLDAWGIPLRPHKLFASGAVKLVEDGHASR